MGGEGGVGCDGNLRTLGFAKERRLIEGDGVVGMGGMGVEEIWEGRG